MGIRAFFARHHTKTETPYLEAARALYAAGARIDESLTPFPCHDVLPTYRVRDKWLARYVGEHATRLRAEVLAFCDALQRNIDNNVISFGVTARDGTCYVFFECVETREILGAMLSYDRRLVPDDEWSRLWGEPRTNGSDEQR